MPKYFDPRDFFPHLKEYFPDESVLKIPLDMEALGEEQEKAANPAYWMHMGQLLSNNAASAPWIWYGMMLGTMESMKQATKKSKKIDKRHAEAVKAVRKFTKHVAGGKAVKPPKEVKKAAKKAAKSASKVMEKSMDSGTELAKETIRQTGNIAQESMKTAQGIANALAAPRGGSADDLQMIAGVGPKLEKILNDLGVFHFDQIATWTPKDVGWVDDYLQFSGRIVRDQWLKQAEALANGGREEYLRVFGKEPR